MIKLGQQARFIDEAAPADLEGVGVPLGADDYRGIRTPRRQRRGHVFLDGDPALQGVVIGEVDDAKAALANQIDYLEFVEAGADRQGFVGAGFPLGRGRGAAWRGGAAQHYRLVVVGIGHVKTLNARKRRQAVGE